MNDSEVKFDAILKCNNCNEYKLHKCVLNCSNKYLYTEELCITCTNVINNIIRNFDEFLL